jgi:hypothetical protein
VQHSEGQANHLQVLAAGGCGDVPRLGAHIVDDRLLEPGNEEVGSLVYNTLANTAQTVEDDGAVAALDIVERSLGETEAGGERDGEAVDGVQCVSHDGVSVVIMSYGIRRRASCITVNLAVACVSMMLALLEARPPPSAFRRRGRFRTTPPASRARRTSRTIPVFLSHPPYTLSSPTTLTNTQHTQNASYSDAHGRRRRKARQVSAP